MHVHTGEFTAFSNRRNWYIFRLAPTDESWRIQPTTPKANISFNLPKVEPVIPVQVDPLGHNPKKKKRNDFLF